MTSNKTTSDLYEGVLLDLSNEWRVVDLPTRWGVQKRDGDWRRKWGWPWRTVAGTHLKSELANLIETVTGFTGTLLVDLPEVHGSYFGRPARKHEDDYNRVVSVFGNWRIIVAPGVPQWTVQHRGRTRWSDIGHTGKREYIGLLIEMAGSELTPEISEAIHRLPKQPITP
jgi:hypothetical protein